jgi:hypothetical protein
VIYVIGERRTGLVKIGLSGAPEGRLRELQTASAGPLDLHLTMQGDHSVEAALHRHFADKCVGNEWFDFGSEDAAVAVVTNVEAAMAAAPQSARGTRRKRLPPPPGDTTRLTVDMARPEARAMKAVAADIAEELEIATVPTRTLLATLGALLVTDRGVRESLTRRLRADLTD